MNFKRVDELLNAKGYDLLNKYREQLTKNNKDASGKLRSSLDFRVEFTDTGAKLYFIAEDYWVNIEEGRRAGAKMPPIQAIQKWVRDKGIERRASKIKRVAYVIARSIGRNGIKAQPLLSNSIEAMLDEFLPELREALRLDLKDYLKETIKLIKK